MENTVTLNATKKARIRRFLCWPGAALALAVFGTLLILLNSLAISTGGVTDQPSAFDASAPVPTNAPQWTVAPLPVRLPGSNPESQAAEPAALAQLSTPTPVQPSPTPVTGFAPDPQNPQTVRVLGPATPLTAGSVLLVLDATNRLQEQVKQGSSWCDQYWYNGCLTDDLVPAALTDLDPASVQFKTYYFLATADESCAVVTADFGDADAAVQAVRQPSAYPRETRSPGEVAAALAEDLSGRASPKVMLLTIANPDTCGVDAAAVEALRQQGVSVRTVSIRGSDEEFKNALKNLSAYYADPGDERDQLVKAIRAALRPGYTISDAAGQIVGQGLLDDDGVKVQPDVPLTVVVDLATSKIYSGVVVSETQGAIIDIGAQ